MSDVIEKARRIKLIATDIDGVWTDAGMYYTEMGETIKKFSTYDGFAVSLCLKAGLEVAVLTGEFSEMVQQRADKLKIRWLYMGESNKLQRIRYLTNRLGILLEETAYIGDDLNDLELLKAAGLSGMPSSSPILDSFTPDITTKRRWGEGAFREFADLILSAKNHP